jgi:hypothetical protein
LDADDTGIGKIAPIFQQLVTQSVDGQRESLAVEEYFSCFHGRKDKCFMRCFFE